MSTMRMVLALMLSALSLNALADEVPVALDKLPKPVVEAVKKRFPKAEMVEAARETEGDKVEFEVTLKEGETKIDVMLTPEGKITLIEKTLPAKALPKAVTDAIEAKYPKATVQLAEELIKVVDGKESFDEFEVLIETADKKRYELKLTPEGKITSTEEKKEEKKD